jgi:hypothetical protein
MTEQDPIFEVLRNEFALWKSFRDVHSARGVDSEASLRAWVADEPENLESPGATDDFLEICTEACLPGVLAATIALLHAAPNLESFWVEIVDNTAARQKAERSLVKTATIIEKLAAGTGTASESIFDRLGHPFRGRLATELRFYPLPDFATKPWW